MSAIDPQILNEFLSESKRLIAESTLSLEKAESQSTPGPYFEEFSNKTDRIMGAAKSLSLLAPENRHLVLLGDCAALCKSLGAQCAKLSGQPRLTEVTTAFLFDALEVLSEVLISMEKGESKPDSATKNVLLERLKWISDLYKQMPKEVAVGEKLNQNEIDDLINKLGMD